MRRLRKLRGTVLVGFISFEDIETFITYNYFHVTSVMFPAFFSECVALARFCVAVTRVLNASVALSHQPWSQGTQPTLIAILGLRARRLISTF